MSQTPKSKKYKVKKRRIIFSKRFIHLVDCNVEMADGRIVSRQVFEHPGSVVIIPRQSRNRYFLIRQFRFAVRDWLWEWPAGGLERGESLKKAAARELTEEIGYYPGKLKKILSFYPTPGVSSERMHMFLAENLRPKTAEKDEDEDLEVHSFTLNEIGALIRKGKIIDAKTILGYMYLKKWMKS